jgi:hypothetical protein
MTTKLKWYERKVMWLPKWNNEITHKNYYASRGEWLYVAVVLGGIAFLFILFLTRR